MKCVMYIQRYDSTSHVLGMLSYLDILPVMPSSTVLEDIPSLCTLDVVTQRLVNS
jgi:hypothetical protein